MKPTKCNRMYSFRSGNRGKTSNNGLVQNKLVGVSPLLYQLVPALAEPPSATTWLLGLRAQPAAAWSWKLNCFLTFRGGPSRTGTYYRKLP